MADLSQHLGARTFDSRVARRMFVLFLACALVPVAGFAIYGYVQVRSQLESDAHDAIGRDAKAAGMSIAERLSIVDARVSAVVGGGELGSEPLPGILRFRVPGLAEAGLPPNDVARLAAGDAVLWRTEEQGRVALELLARMKNARATLVAAELDPHFVFVPERLSEGERYWVEDEDGRLLFAAPDEPDTYAFLASRSDHTTRSHFEGRSSQGPELGTVWPIFLGGHFGRGNWNVGMSRSKRAVLRPLAEFERSFPVFAGLTIAAALLVSLRQIRRILVPLEALAHFAEEMGAGNLEAQVVIDSGDEFEDLAATFKDMAAQIRLDVAVLGRLNEIGQALSSEQDVSSFLDLALAGAAELTGSDACAFVLGDDEDGFEVPRLRIDGQSATVDSAQASFLSTLGRRACRTGQAIGAERATEGDSNEADDWEAFAAASGLAAKSLHVIPLRNEKGVSLGALVLLSRDSESVAFPEAVVDLAESLASQAAIAICQSRSIEGLRNLFEGLIHLTVRAIDEKSPYTGEHCRKVPILTEMIAEAACGTTIGPLKDFDLSDEERYELRIAAQLHDCGKVVTPVHVMDKATKLETLCDRIELVRTRFELVRRDLELRSLRERLAQAEGSTARLEAEQALAAQLRLLDDDMRFLERANVGGESMSDRDRERVAAIAGGHTWIRQDGSEHPLVTDDELRNLLVGRGTLNEDERRVMEEHVVSTISLLEELPFPKELRNVAAIAGGHHEHVDGRGYPKGLGGERLSMQARMLGLADVFEALTAKTRPYKPGMTLSKTLSILKGLRDSGHIDPHLHDLFVQEKVYLRYAVEHLDPEQIDSVHREDLEERSAPWA